MDILPFIDVDRENVGEFLDLNALAHESIFTALLLAGVIIEHYPLWTPEPDNDWLEIHYREHVAWSSALGVPLPADLSTVDLTEDASRGPWLYNHALHHGLVSQALGL